TVVVLNDRICRVAIQVKSIPIAALGVRERSYIVGFIELNHNIVRAIRPKTCWSAASGRVRSVIMSYIVLHNTAVDTVGDNSVAGIYPGSSADVIDGIAVIQGVGDVFPVAIARHAIVFQTTNTLRTVKRIVENLDVI